MKGNLAERVIGSAGWIVLLFAAWLWFANTVIPHQTSTLPMGEVYARIWALEDKVLWLETVIVGLCFFMMAFLFRFRRLEKEAGA